MQGQIPDQLSEPRKSVLPSVSRLVSEKFECVGPLLPKSTGFVSLATPQWSSIAKYCCWCEWSLCVNWPRRTSSLYGSWLLLRRQSTESAIGNEDLLWMVRSRANQQKGGWKQACCALSLRIWLGWGQARHETARTSWKVLGLRITWIQDWWHFEQSWRRKSPWNLKENN